MSTLLKTGLFLIMMLKVLTSFGQTSPSNIIIKTPHRYIDEKGDTLSVFRIQDERIIAYGLQSLNDCRDENILADSVIHTADSLLKAKDQKADILTQEKQNLIEQGTIKDKTITSYDNEVRANRKQIATLKAQKLFYQITSGILILTTTYLLIK